MDFVFERLRQIKQKIRALKNEIRNCRTENRRLAEENALLKSEAERYKRQWEACKDEREKAELGRLYAGHAGTDAEEKIDRLIRLIDQIIAGLENEG